MLSIEVFVVVVGRVEVWTFGLKYNFERIIFGQLAIRMIRKMQTFTAIKSFDFPEMKKNTTSFASFIAFLFQTGRTCAKRRSCVDQEVHDRRRLRASHGIKPFWTLPTHKPTPSNPKVRR